MSGSSLAPRPPKHLGFRATLGAILAAGICYVLGCDGLTSITAGGLTAFSIRIALIDLKLRVILNRDIIALTVIGLIWVFWTASDPFVDLTWAFLRGISYAALFQTIRLTYVSLRGRDGMGFGDVKLATVAGPLLYVDVFALSVSIASLGGLSFVILRSRLKGRRRSQYIFVPFGSCLILSFLFCWVYVAL